MNNKYLKPALAVGLLTVALGVGSAAFAENNTKGADELAGYVSARPEIQTVIQKIEADTGGKVISAGNEDEMKDSTLIELEVQLPDGSEQNFVYNPSDKSVNLKSSDIQDNQNDHENDNIDENDHENDEGDEDESEAADDQN